MNRTGTPAAAAYIALGSNMGDRQGCIDGAIASLRRVPGVTVEAVSSLIETDPVGPIAQPMFLNAVCHVATTLTPRELLTDMLCIERSFGRRRDHASRWGPRTLDLDLILYADMVIAEDDLIVPHPRLFERAFVLEPLCEIGPDVVVPGTQGRASATVSVLLERLIGDRASSADRLPLCP